MDLVPRRSRIVVEGKGEITVVNFIDTKLLIEQNVDTMGENLFSLVDELGRKKILLNFRNVEYCSGQALGKFIALNKKCFGDGGKLVMCNINDDVFEVFAITKLDRLFNIAPDEQTALQMF